MLMNIYLVRHVILQARKDMYKWKFNFMSYKLKTANPLQTSGSWANKAKAKFSENLCVIRKNLLFNSDSNFCNIILIHCQIYEPYTLHHF